MQVLLSREESGFRCLKCSPLDASFVVSAIYLCFVHLVSVLGQM